MKIWSSILAAALMTGILGAAETVYEQKFDESFKIGESQGIFASIKKLDDEKTALVVSYPKIIEKCNPSLYLPIKVDDIAGKKIKVSVKVKGDNISKPEKHWHGGKFNLMIVNHEDKTLWPGPALGGGTFDWKDVSFTTDIPYGVKRVGVILGLQATTGDIMFRDLKIETLDD